MSSGPPGEPGAHTKVVMLPVHIALCGRILTCRRVGSLIQSYIVLYMTMGLLVHLCVAKKFMYYAITSVK